MFEIQATEDLVKVLVERELSAMTDRNLAGFVGDRLVPVVPMDLTWGKGPPSVTFRTWKVLEDEHECARIAIVYCSEGGSPRTPWGVLHTGMADVAGSSEWFASLTEAMTMHWYGYYYYERRGRLPRTGP